MITDIWLFSLFLLITGALIFILVFFIITLSGEDRNRREANSV